MHVLGIIGGSGLYDIPGLKDVEEVEISTPYGRPSDAIVQGRLGDTKLLFLPRHGRGHRFAPHEINYRANICALHGLGATHLLSISAVGSMKEHIAPGHLVVVDQFLDWTKRRVSTFFEGGIVGHVPFADPTSGDLSRAAGEAVQRAGGTVHRGGTYVCIDGPQFSTRAESAMFRSFGVSVIGMTAMPEAKLAREAGLAFALLALVTDYDCWHESEATVSVDAVLATVRSNVGLARRCVAELASSLHTLPPWDRTRDIRSAVMTDPTVIPSDAGAALSWLLPPSSTVATRTT
jgi:5'-methylthioadenosine phosphorylase